MTHKSILLLFISIGLQSTVYSQPIITTNDTLFTTKISSKAASTVVKELKQNIEKKHLQLFSEIAHHTEAEKVGEQLRFTHVILFGSPKVGTKLMQCDQRMGYELPLRILVTTDKAGQTLVSFRDPQKYSRKYALTGCEGILEKMSALLHELTNQVL